ncbi:MAG: SlyX protein [Xanthomonadales bacterium]|mgnify:CR=1 FL=1|nr:SlyX protein [Xanthomonadales bacterium]|tara:strand:- start:48 stop:257 length:210 start_codon:yes stop_codon:yes gene_type:complete
MPEPTLDELEIRIAYQDDTIRQLSEQIYRQDQALARLEARCQALEQRLTQMQEQDGEIASSGVERPPHY